MKLVCWRLLRGGMKCCRGIEQGVYFGEHRVDRRIEDIVECS